jgi:hypothetical protein
LIADLFHGIFETWHFHHSAFPIEQRQVIRDLIGKETEFLAYAFCVTGRPQAFLVHAGLPDIALKDHHAGGMIRLSSAALTVFLKSRPPTCSNKAATSEALLKPRSVLASDDPRPTLVLASRSDIDLERQVTAPGATWLDYRLVERERMPLAAGGFGQEVRDALAARAEHLAAEGLIQGQGTRIVMQRDLLATLRRRELDAVGARLSTETGLPYTPAAGGETVAGTYCQRLPLTSDRFAMIDNGLGFALVPWTPALDRHLGRHVAGVAKESGGIEWSFERKRGLEI